jgi:hypothetical protein
LHWGAEELGANEQGVSLPFAPVIVQNKYRQLANWDVAKSYNIYYVRGRIINIEHV